MPKEGGWIGDYEIKLYFIYEKELLLWSYKDYNPYVFELPQNMTYFKGSLNLMNKPRASRVNN